MKNEENVNQEVGNNPTPAEAGSVTNVAPIAETIAERSIQRASDLPITDYFHPVIWEQMKGIAHVFAASGALAKDDNAAKLLMKLQAGREMGMKPIESIKSFYFVNGTLNIYGAAVIRRLREHGWTIQYKDSQNQCTATIIKGKERHVDTLTFEEAEKSGWTKSTYGVKAGWIDGINRKTKLRYGVISLMIKTYVPEVLGSAVDIVEVAEDFGSVDAPRKELPTLVDGDKPASDTTLASLKAMDKGFEYFDEEGHQKMPMNKQEAATALANIMQKKGGTQ